MASIVKRKVGRPRKSPSTRRNVQPAISSSNDGRIVNEKVGTLLEKRIMTGDLPPFSDWSNTVVDHANHRVFLYGGCHPKDDFFSSNFHCCDIRTMRWIDCTHSLQFLSHPLDAFANQSCQRPLPALQKPGCTFLSVHGKAFMFIFGGRSGSQANPPQLIAVDLEEEAWWVVEIEGGPVLSRMSCCMFGEQDHLYIFGGSSPYDDNAPFLSSFSVAEFKDGKWKWTVRDQAYPAHVPCLGFSGQATSVYDGKKILLTMGRLENEASIKLSKDTMVLFHTTHHTFQVQTDTSGPFPQEVSWYELHYLPPQLSLLRPKPPFPSPVSTRSSLRRVSARTPPISTSTSTSGPATKSTPPSAVICAWISHADHLTPELWRYMLPPEEEIQCLELREQIWDLNLDLQAFVVVGNRLFFLGYDAPPDVDEETALRRSVWNVCVEVSLTG